MPSIGAYIDRDDDDNDKDKKNATEKEYIININIFNWVTLSIKLQQAVTLFLPI